MTKLLIDVCAHLNWCMLTDAFKMQVSMKQEMSQSDTYHRPQTNECTQLQQEHICTMGCPPVRGDNPRALASGLSYVQADKHGITILYHQHQCRPGTSRDISCLSW